MRLVAWGCAFGLAACQLVAGITDGSSGGPCSNDSDCPETESCVEAHCKEKSASSGAGAGAKAGGGGMSGVAADGGRTSTGGSSGQGGSSAAAGGSGMSQAGAAALQGGDGGKGGVSSGGRSAGGDSGDAGDGGAGDASGNGGGGGGGGGAGGRGTGGAGGDGAGAGGAGGGGAGSGGAGGSAGMAAGSGGISGMAGTGGAGPIRIMPLGDGITASTCMRAFLWKKLTDNAYPAFDFVGTRTSADACSPTAYDKNNEGHNGYRVSDLLSATSQHTDSGGDPYTGSSADLAAWFDGRPADIVLMLFGSNDFLSTSSSAADVQNAYSAILAKLRSVNARVTLLVGLLPPMATDKCNTSCASRRSDLNAAIPSWAASASSAQSRVVVVDMTAFDVTNTTDGIKPNDVGAQFLADRWYEALDLL